MAKVESRLEQWDADALLRAPATDVVQDLIAEGTVVCPRLLTDQMWMTDPTEVKTSSREFGETVERTVTRLVLVVPFEGEREVFLARANRGSFNPPRVLALSESELQIVLDGDIASPQAARAFFDEQLASIEEHLEWSRAEIDRHNEQLAARVPVLVSKRRETLLATRNLQAQIGFPVRRRDDAQTYTVPVSRRKLRSVQPTAVAQQRFTPEPAMAQADYVAALGVLRNSRNALERTPSLAAKLDEEQIRDLLLINLNAVFEGDAAGEVFNGAGKTDILIRVKDRNIFIGECKVWGGPSTMDDALSQLFGYLVWRDTKAAILLFVRNKDVTAVIGKAVQKIESHPNFKRRASPPAEDEHSFVIHAQDDPEREIHLALLTFALRSPS